MVEKRTYSRQRCFRKNTSLGSKCSVWPQLELQIQLHLLGVGNIVLGDLEWKDKKFILKLVNIEELGSVWAGYCQSYNLGRLIGFQNVALERERRQQSSERLLQWQSRNARKAYIRVMQARRNKTVRGLRMKTAIWVRHYKRKGHKEERNLYDWCQWQIS